MSTKGIIFSASMVRALLAGTKTQTRRLIKPCPWPDDRGPPYVAPYPEGARAVWCDPFDDAVRLAAPFVVGDRLYVREAFSYAEALADTVWYWADGNFAAFDCSKPKPSIHMPRWASRLWLEVTEVRVQRLQDISEADAIAEGIERGHHPDTGEVEGWRDYETIHEGPHKGEAHPHAIIPYACPWRSYSSLWDELHTEPGTRWEDNPWVCAVSFAVHHGNVDEVAA